MPGFLKTPFLWGWTPMAMCTTSSQAAPRTVWPVQAAAAPGRIGWSQLLARVFKLDVTKCGACGGRLRVVETVSSFERLQELGALGEARGPPGGRPVTTGQLELSL